MSATTMMAASLALTLVSTGVSYMAQKQNQTAQVKAQEINALNTRNAAVQAMIDGNDSLQQREQQESASTALRIQNAKTKAREATSTAVATSESSGLSMDALLSDYDRQYSSYADTQMQQLGFTNDQLERSRQGLQSQAEGRINTMPLNPVAGPSLLGSALEFGAGALSSFETFAVRDPQTGSYSL